MFISSERMAQFQNEVDEKLRLKTSICTKDDKYSLDTSFSVLAPAQSHEQFSIPPSI